MLIISSFGGIRSKFTALLTVVVFGLGMLLGIAFENSKVDEINEYYVQSEISLMEVPLVG